MASALELFLDKISAEDGVSAATLAAYEKDITQFLALEKVLPEKIKAGNIADFARYLTDRHFAVKTLNRKISALRRFCKFLIEEKILSENPLTDITTPKREKPLPKFLTPEQVELLYNKAAEDKSIAFQRAAVIVKLMFSSGMRVSEVLNVSLNAINHNKKQISVRGKGAKDRIVFFDDQTNKALFDYINNIRPLFLRKKQISNFLFPSKTALSGHLTRDAFFKDLKQLAVLCGISPFAVSPHVLRHSFATNLINHEADLRSVQKMLGHENISTTEIYTHITSQKIIDSVFEKHPLKDFRRQG